MQHLDEGTIHAWLDGELSADEAARAEAHVTACATCADAVAEARGFIAASSRILTALDNVPSIKSAGSAGSARWGRRPLATWLVRERIAAVVAVIVAGGALTLVLSRPADEAARVDLAAEPMRTFELATVDSSPPPEGDAATLRSDVSTSRATRPEAAPAAPPAARDLASARQADSAPVTVAMGQQMAPGLMKDSGARAPVRTDDSLRSVTIASAQRAEAEQRSVEGKSAILEKIPSGLGRRRASEAPARFAEPLPAASSIGGATGAAAPGREPRLIQEEKMTESGREVRRRIYQVDDLLVTLDERLPVAAEEARRAQAANAAPADSTPGVTTIRWSGAGGMEFTLRGPAPRERLEQIRKLLGY